MKQKLSHKQSPTGAPTHSKKKPVQHSVNPAETQLPVNWGKKRKGYSTCSLQMVIIGIDTCGKVAGTVGVYTYQESLVVQVLEVVSQHLAQAHR